MLHYPVILLISLKSEAYEAYESLIPLFIVLAKNIVLILESTKPDLSSLFVLPVLEPRIRYWINETEARKAVSVRIWVG